MNLALSALIIIILLLPGSVFIKSYYTAFKEKVADYQISFNELALKGLIFSLFIHSSAICIIKILGYEIDFSFLYNIIISKDEFRNADFSNNVLQFFLYNTLIIIFSFLISKLAKTIVRKNNLDLKYHSLNYTNYWFFIFSGRFFIEQNTDKLSENVDLIWVDVLLDNDVIYSGFLIDFYYSSKENELETLILKNAQKIICNHSSDGITNKSVTSDPQDIPGDFFILPMNKMVNINVYYINYKNTDEIPSATAP